MRKKATRTSPTSLATLAATKRLEIGPELCSGFCVSRASPKPRGSSKGAIAQLGERLHGIKEGGGSIPPASPTLPPLRGFRLGKPQCGLSWRSERGKPDRSED